MPHLLQQILKLQAKIGNPMVYTLLDDSTWVDAALQAPRATLVQQPTKGRAVIAVEDIPAHAFFAYYPGYLYEPDFHATLVGAGTLDHTYSCM